MKPLQYSLNHGDVEAILAALSILPALDFDDIDSSSLCSLCMSTGIKLAEHSLLTAQETRIVVLAIDCAYKALCNSLPLDEDSLCEIRKYFFTYQKLHSVFLSGS